ncbi:hypothetical protein GCM10009551_037830 [Nocardiopsis tropica]|uniref:hypothetical protein n=1 Tax=Tsukamurella strandjordii TaxID=147577 RepID=UPI0031D1AF9A
MNSSLSFDPALLYVHISRWEYQCCGEVPRRGGTVLGALTLYPSHRPGYPAPVVHDWDTRSGLVQIGDVVAQLGHSVTDPYRTDIIISLGWHGHGLPPQVAGRIELLVEETGRYVRGPDGTFTIDPSTVEYREVREATRRPEDRAEPGGPAAPGVVAGIRVTDVHFPTQDEIDARVLREDRDRRTVVLAGPAACFGPTAPEVGGVIEVDLGDVRLSKNGLLSTLTHRVRGEVVRASAMSRPSHSHTGFGARTAQPPERLMVRLVIDPDDAR